MAVLNVFTHEGVGVGVAAGLGVAAGFFAADVAFGFGACFGFSFFAADAAAGGCAAGGVSEICADAVVAANARPARIDMGRRRFMSGVIPVRSFLFQAVVFQALRHAPV